MEVCFPFIRIMLNTCLNWKLALFMGQRELYCHFSYNTAIYSGIGVGGRQCVEVSDGLWEKCI